MNFASEAAFKLELLRLLKTVVSLPIVWFNNSTERPPKPFITLFVSSTEGIGDDVTRATGILPGGDIAWTQTGLKRSAVSVQVFGADAVSTMVDVQRAVQGWKLRDASLERGISFTAGGVRDLSTLVSTAFESRAQMDCVALWVLENQVDAVPIEHAVLNGQTIGVGGTE